MTFLIHHDRNDRVPPLDRFHARALERTCDNRCTRAKAAGSAVEWRAGNRPTP